MSESDRPEEMVTDSEMPDEEFAPVPPEVGDVSLRDYANFCRSMIDWLRQKSRGE